MKNQPKETKVLPGLGNMKEITCQWGEGRRKVRVNQGGGTCFVERESVAPLKLNQHQPWMRLA